MPPELSFYIKIVQILSMNLKILHCFFFKSRNGVIKAVVAEVAFQHAGSVPAGVLTTTI
jgi:hypothetical protein